MPGKQAAGEVGTATRILDVAERLVQSRGFNGFSYANVAAELGMTKASLHYHFPGKAELGEALINRYAIRFAEALQAIDADSSDVRAKLAAYAAVYADVLSEQRMCLCGMLAADYETLPAAMRSAVVRFFDDNETGSSGFWSRARKKARCITRVERGTSPADHQHAGRGDAGRPAVRRSGRFRAAAHRLLATLDGE